MECFSSWFVLIAGSKSLKNLPHSCFYHNCYNWLRWLVLASISNVWVMLLVKAIAEENVDEGESL